MIQRAIVDIVVLAAALWLAWTFAPYGVRRNISRLLPRGSRARRLAASPTAAGGVEGLQAVEIDGRPAAGGERAGGDCGPGCGCS